MDLNKLRSFVAVAELGSLTSAAGVVNLTQSAVSQQLKELESELDTKLLDRSRRPVTLTKEGAEFAPVAQQMLQIWQTYKEQQTRKVFEGKLTIGYVSSIMNSIFANALKSLRDHHPKLIVKLVNIYDITSPLANMVCEGEIDACLSVGPLQPPKGLLWRPYSVERYFVISTNQRGFVNDEELLKNGPYLRFTPHLLPESKIDKEIKRRGIKVDGVMECESYSGILLMVEHGMGVGIVPESYLRGVDETLISRIPFSVPPLTREMGILVRHDNPKKYIVDALWKAMHNYSINRSNFQNSNVALESLR